MSKGVKSCQKLSKVVKSYQKLAVEHKVEPMGRLPSPNVDQLWYFSGVTLGTLLILVTKKRGKTNLPKTS